MTRHTILSKYAVAAIMLAAVTYTASAQTDTPAMPFLRMETDARTAGLGGAGSVLPDNPAAIYGNAAVSVLGESRGGATLFTGPWGNSVSDSGHDALYGAGGYWTPDGRNGIVAGLRCYGGSRISLSDDAGFPAGTARPWDLSAEAGYARRFGKHVAVSLTARYMRSDFGTDIAPMQGVAFDVGAAFRGSMGSQRQLSWLAGIHISDIGPNLKGSDGTALHLPSRVSIEGALLMPFSKNHEINMAADAGCCFFNGEIYASFGAEYKFLRHGVIRAGYHVESNRGAGSYASVGCGFIVGPVRCDAAYRLGGNDTDPRNNSVVVSIGFVL